MKHIASKQNSFVIFQRKITNVEWLFDLKNDLFFFEKLKVKELQNFEKNGNLKKTIVKKKNSNMKVSRETNFFKTKYMILIYNYI
jgi:hypothetical protein